MEREELRLTEREMKLIFQLMPAFTHAFFEEHAQTGVNLEGLNKSHVHAVVFLKINGPSAMSTVAKFLGLEKGSFTPVASRLLDWGFVTREVDPMDRRRQVLRLTDSGLSFSQQLRKHRAARFAEQIDKLTKMERKQFFQMLERLEDLLVKINGGVTEPPAHRFMLKKDSAEEMTQ